MIRPTSIVDNPLVRQAPISGLLALSAFLSVVMPSLVITEHDLFVASVVGMVVATLLSAIPTLVRRAAWVVPILLTVDFLTIALLRTGTGAGASVFTALVVLPVIWWASLEGRRTVVFAVLGLLVVMLAPYVLTPTDPPGPSELVRVGAVVIVFGTVAVVVHELSRRSRLNLRSAEAREGKVRAEIDRAAAVQRSLLPTTTGRITDDVVVAGACLPARSVGGDFFDWYPTNSGVAVSLGDVMGKGVGAGLIAAAVRSTLRSARTVDDPAEALKRASDGLTAEGVGPDLAFTTLFHARISDDGTLRWSDAGHGLSFVLRADGHVDRLRSGDMPLGLGIREEWATTEGTLEPGDLLVSFSDGVLDLYDDLDQTIESVAEIARAGRDPHAVVLALSARADEVPHDDDVTVIAIRRQPVEVDTERPLAMRAD
ncbi:MULTISPECIES: SpoIIE family protein phosphatase [unclassified Curtobacterium]|uniref:PP2C family protein-serine/threonine phosphatase n=1 Tax=unclassified Curtobacterium TaxID=257496 RepID=UPI000D93CF91|nr:MULTISPECIES: SpoIIE family protein phosphatase [unclassified Curtobacterium]PYY65839.1 regulator [Curtobacterium sp. MCPF17_003]PZF33055.1 regulator [Curtobacterium sp. MCPF17_051]WIB71324.1 SpoIIE family protein phosphatase [Curtobacterium sp. MCBD17_026]